MSEGRILAIDYGTKRVGLAVTDENCIIAGGLCTLMSQNVMPFLKTYVKKEKVKCIVLGEPRQLNNKPSESHSHVMKFGQTLRKNFPAISIVLLDERFTSKMAFQTMIDAGLKKSDRRNKELVDTVSAVILLQSYMEASNNINYKPFYIN